MQSDDVVNQPQRPFVSMLQNGYAQQLPFPCCLKRSLVKLGVKPCCSNPGAMIHSVGSSPVEISLVYSLARMQLLISADSSGSNCKEGSLFRAGDELFTSVPIQHATSCPAAALDDIQPLATVATQDCKPVRPAVSVLVLDHLGRVLLTRRGKTMRAFPGFWVMPGGHVDAGEKLTDAAVREVAEEVGLKVKVDMKAHCAWESCFPILLEHGPPKVQHVVVYFLAPMEHSSAVNMQAVEVDGYVWLDKQQVRRVCTAQAGTEETVDGMESEEGGEGSPVRIRLADVAARMAEGARFALMQWSAEPPTSSSSA